MELFEKFVIAAIVTAVLCTILIDGGWMIWIPVVPALATAFKIRKMLG